MSRTPQMLDYAFPAARAGQSRAGAASIVIGICAFALLAVSVYTALTYRARVVIIQTPTTRAVPTPATQKPAAVVRAVAVIVAGTGLVIGIGGVRSRVHQRGLAVVGMVINGVVLLILLLGNA